MLGIGLHGLSVVLTALIIGALKKGGKTIPIGPALFAGITLAYVYQRSGDPWSVISDQARQLTVQIGDESGGSAAAIALAIAALWYYIRPGPKGSVLLGFLLMSAASAATGLVAEATSIFGSLIQTLAG